MPEQSFRAHFDGEQIVPDEPIELAKGTPLMVIVGSNKADAESRYPPAERQPRMFALLLGAGYMLFVAQLFSQVTQWSFGKSFGVTLIGCVIVMAALALLGLKAYRKKDAG